MGMGKLACLLACLLASCSPWPTVRYGLPLLGLRRALSYSSQWTAPFRGLKADGRCCCGKSCANTVRLVSGHLVWNSCDESDSVFANYSAPASPKYFPIEKE